MSVSNSEKSILAKLLASENIRIEHQKVATAAFNLRDRALILPIWKEMSADLYDLLIGHEIGHATPSTLLKRVGTMPSKMVATVSSRS